MVVKKKAGKASKKASSGKSAKPAKAVIKKEVEEEEHSGGASLDDAFGDDEDVSYAESKPKKEKKKKVEDDEDDEEIEEELDEIQHAITSVERGDIEIKQSKPVTKVKKGDKIKIDGVEYEVDAHYVLIDHGTTKEMTIEVFDPKKDKDFQLRYFDDQLQATLDLYELQEILYVKRSFRKVEW